MILHSPLTEVIACASSPSQLGTKFQARSPLFTSAESRHPLWPVRNLNLSRPSFQLYPSLSLRFSASSLEPVTSCEDSLFLHILEENSISTLETSPPDNGIHEQTSVKATELQDDGSREENLSHAEHFDRFDFLTERRPAGRRRALLVGRQVFLTGRKDYQRWLPRVTPNSAEDGQESSEALLQEEGFQVSSENLVQEEEARHIPPVEGEERVPCSSSSDSERKVSLQVDDEVENPRHGNERRSQLRRLETGLPEETTEVSSEPHEDFLTQFLKKRSKNWKASWKDRLRKVEQRYALDQTCTPEEISSVRERDVSGQSCRVLSTSLSDIPSLELQSESLYSSTGGGHADDSGRLIQGILSIAKGLPQNVPWEDLLGDFQGKISTYDGNRVLKSLKDENLTWPLLSFFQWMRNHDPCLVDSWTFCIVFTHLGKVDMVDRALALFRSIPEGGGFHCVEVYNSLLAALAKCNRGEQIPRILQHMKDGNVKFDSVTYSILITATKGREPRRLEMVWSIFDDMLREGLRPSLGVYGSVIKAFCDEGHLQKAVSLSLSMKKMGLIPNEIIFNTLIDAHSKACLLEEAEGLLLEMKEMGMHPTRWTYNSLLNGYGRNGQSEVAEELVLEMQNEGLRPDVFTYTSLVSGYAKQKMTEKAVNAFLRMRKIGIAPTSHTYTALINAYSEGGWHVKAQRAFDNMIREGLRPTVETYTALLDAYRRAGDIDMVNHVWRTIKDDSTCKLTRVTYRTAVDSYAKYGLYNEARDVIAEFRKRGIQPDTMIFNMLLNAAARGGLYSKLPKLLFEMRATGCEPDPFTYCTVIYAALRHRDFTSAFRYEREMTESGQLPEPKTYAKMRHLLNAKYATKIENDRKAEAGSKNEEGPQTQTFKCKNPQKKKRRFNLFSKRRPVQLTNRNKAPWKTPDRKNLPY